ncbi:hypothetical protein [Dechloromonas sp. A34]|uniref:hypothetical protein n=1 Tax=Dechloromonas sp. A34 TaxID=447588 RepID=UPI0022490EC3|nr:hypothetical protein [Dechloromonas sp. A34]
MKKTEEVLPGLKERIAESTPELARRIEEWVSDAALPKKDVGGEDIEGIPRFPGMVRVAFGVQEQKKSVAYKGESGFAEVIVFYAREMAKQGFSKEVTSASTAEETHVYTKGSRRFALKFVKTVRLATETTDVEVREL